MMKYRMYATVTDNVHGQFLQSSFMQQQPRVYSQLRRVTSVPQSPIWAGLLMIVVVLHSGVV